MKSGIVLAQRVGCLLVQAEQLRPHLQCLSAEIVEPRPAGIHIHDLVHAAVDHAQSVAALNPLGRRRALRDDEQPRLSLALSDERRDELIVDAVAALDLAEDGDAEIAVLIAALRDRRADPRP